jgi:hypothetical protein
MLVITGYTSDETKQAIALWREWKREMSKAEIRDRRRVAIT